MDWSGQLLLRVIGRLTHFQPWLSLIVFLSQSVVMVDSVDPEHRFCCEHTQILQHGYRPDQCLINDECNDVSQRILDLVRFYICLPINREPRTTKFPLATVSTDRTEGWSPTDRDLRKYNWVDSQDGLGQWATIALANVRFLDEAKVGPNYAFVNPAAGGFLSPYTVPGFVSLYHESCRPYDHKEVTYHNYPLHHIYKVMDVTLFTECYWVIHYSYVTEPYNILLPYFNEREEEEVKEKLENPTSTSYFDPVQTEKSARGYFAFPYFLIVRMVCQDEGYYGEEFYYNLGDHGHHPQMELFYTPITSREDFENPLAATLGSVVVNLLQDEDKLMVPDPDVKFDTRLAERQFKSLADPEKELCFLNLCYPAFAYPQPFLQMPMFKATIGEDVIIAKLQTYIYVNLYHSRTTRGTGQIEFAKQFQVGNTTQNVTSVHPRYFFPKKLIPEEYGDYDLDRLNLHTCTNHEIDKLTYSFDIPASFFLSGRENQLFEVIQILKGLKEASLPLTFDDFYTPQYTFGSSPVVAFAGFHRPDLLIMGDPDMDKFDLIQWDYNSPTEQDTWIFDANGPCLSKEKLLRFGSKFTTPKPDVTKPIYSTRQKDEIRRYDPGRRSYAALNYSSSNTKAIFGVISLENRLLLQTTSGLVAVYGSSYTTRSVDKVFKAPKDERLPVCFKFIRSLNVALLDFDPILGVSYDYSFRKKHMHDNGTLGDEDEVEEHKEEIWYGQLRDPAKKIEWTELGSKEYQDTLIAPVHIPSGITHEEKTQDISEAAKICKLVYSTYVLPIFPNDANRTAFQWKLDPERHNCIILDGSPKPSEPNVIQLLVEMTFTFYKSIECNPDAPEFDLNSGPCEPFNPRRCMRYLYCAAVIPNIPSPVFPYDCTRHFEDVIRKCPIPFCTVPLRCTVKTPGNVDPCNCPTCYDVTLQGPCQNDHCHPPCAECPTNLYNPYPCSCETHYRSNGAETAVCQGDILRTNCSDCRQVMQQIGCPSSPFGPCAPGKIPFCPDEVIARRHPPFCPRCIPSFRRSLDGWYDYPQKEWIHREGERHIEALSDYDLCRDLIVAEPTPERSCQFHIQDIKLYVIAQHQFGKKLEERENAWKIISVHPKRPCSVSHWERVFSYPAFDERYFGDVSLGDGRIVTCFEKFFFELHADVEVTNLVYTRQPNNHLFVYGSKLLHSVDGGQSFVVMRDFPATRPSTVRVDYDYIKILGLNKIRVMAFSSSAQYAFLTTFRELYLGTIGSLRQALIRPSRGWSMCFTKIYKYAQGTFDAPPFSLMFDAFGNLFELAALRDPEAHVESIIKRPVDTQIILRNNHFVEQLEKYTNEQILIALKTGSNPDHHVSTITPPILPGNTLYLHYNIRDVSLYCPFSQLKMTQNYTKTLSRLQRFRFYPPVQHALLGFDHKISSLMAYSVATFGMVYEAFLHKEKKEFYSHVERDPINKWHREKTEEAYAGYIRYLRKDPKKSGIVVDPRQSAARVNTKNPGHISHYWIDYNHVVEILLTFYLKNAQLLTKTDFIQQKLSEIQVNVDNGDGELLRLNTEREILGKEAGVRFRVYISLFKSDKLQASIPGKGLRVIPISFHFIGGFGRCFNLEQWGMVGEALTTQVVAGCPPAADLLFDWNSTLYSLQFRDTKLKYGDADYCDEGEIVCFHVDKSLVFNFDILDIANQLYIPFTGKYKLQVIGGGRDKDNLKDYNTDKIDAFNVPGKSDISLIWALTEEGNDIERDPETQENVLTSGTTRIKWVCNTLSPCARVLPGWNLHANFYFKILITNKGIDSETLCVHEREFIIMLYGFTPSPEISLLVTFLTCSILLSIMYFFYFCCRRNRRVWRANKLRLTGWLQIVKDTFPKQIKIEENKEAADRRKDSIILSLQGHLNVPQVLAKPTDHLDDLDSASFIAAALSKVSMDSEGSEASLPRVRPRKKAATWTDMVYEQIISQRLLSIVNRNRRMREHVLKSPPPAKPGQPDLHTPLDKDSLPRVPSVPVVQDVKPKPKEGKKTV